MARDRKFANGEGSITYVKGRKSPWWARLPATYDINGKEHRPTVGFFKSRKEAKKALDSYAGVEDIKTFNDLYQAYKTTSEFKNFTKNNKNRYERAFEAFYPVHKKPINEIKYSQLQAIVDRVKDKGYTETINGKKVKREYSHDHLKRLKVLLKKLYKLALKNDLVQNDLSKLVEIDGLKLQRKKEIFSNEEIHKLEESIPTNPDARYILIMIFTGLRTTEFINLNKDNIEFKTNEIHDFGIKTDAGKKRKMFIHPKIRTYLKELYLSSKSGYIVEHKGKWVGGDVNFYNQVYYPALEKAGVKRKIPYSCRYTFATIAYQSGVNEKALQKLMGHTNFGITANSYIQDMDEFIYEELQKIN